MFPDLLCLRATLAPHPSSPLLPSKPRLVTHFLMLSPQNVVSTTAARPDSELGVIRLQMETANVEREDEGECKWSVKEQLKGFNDHSEAGSQQLATRDGGESGHVAVTACPQTCPSVCC